MKKRILTFICIITCLLSLCACGNTETTSAVQSQKISQAQQFAPNVITLVSQYLCQNNPIDVKDYTNEEIEYICEQAFGVKVDGYAMVTAVESFNSALETIGEITNVGNTEVTLDGKQLVCQVEVEGTNKNAKAEIILSNDMFLKIESASLNPVSTMGDLMEKAALNTVIGMGTVFVVLILISLIISMFGLIPKLQASMANRKAKKNRQDNAGIDNAVAQITAQESAMEEEDDLELVAVISAAIAAYEGSTSTDGFVVRSIRKR